MREKKLELFKTILIFLLLAFLVLNLYLILNSTFEVSTPHSIMNGEKLENSYDSICKPYKFEFKSGKNDSMFSYEIDREIYDSLFEYLIEILSHNYEIEKIDLKEFEDYENYKISFYYDEFLPMEFVLKGNKVKLMDGELIGALSFVFTDKIEVLVHFKSASYRIIVSYEDKEITDNIKPQEFGFWIRNVLSLKSLRYKRFVFDDGDLLGPKFVYRGYYSPQVFKIEPEFDFDDTSVRNTLVSSFFGAKSSFVKEGENINGEKIYFSSYGDETLHLSNIGKVNYKSKFYGEDTFTSVDEDIFAAINFQKSRLNMGDELYLYKYIQEDKTSGIERTFYFKTDKFNMPVEVDGGFYGLIIKVRSAQVVEYTRYLPDINEEFNDVRRQGKTYREDSILEILTKEDVFNRLREDYFELYENDDSSANPEEIKNRVLEFIESVEFSYYVKDGKKLEPCYLIKYPNGHLLVDFYTEKGVTSGLD